MNNPFHSFTRRSLYPWLVFILATSFYFYKCALEVSPSVMANDWMQAFSLNGAALGNLGACYFYAYLMMQFPMGILLDSFSPKRVIATFLFLCALGTFVLGHSHGFYSAAFGRFLTGFGAAAAGIGCCKLITVWFPSDRFAFLLGLMLSAGMVGSVFGQAPLSQVVDMIGWQATLINASYLGLLLTICFALIVRSRPSISAGTPQEFGETKTPQHRFNAKEFLQGVLPIIKRKESWILAIYAGLAFSPIMAFGGLWGVPYLRTVNGLSETLAAGAVSTMFIGFAIGAPLMGWFSNFIGRRIPVIVIGTILSLVLLSTVFYVHSWSMHALSFLLFFAGINLSVSLLGFSLIREGNRLSLAGTALGFMNTFSAIIGALTDPLLGFLLDKQWHGQMLGGARIFSAQSYHVAISILPLFLLLSLGCLFFIHETYCKQVQDSAEGNVSIS